MSASQWLPLEQRRSSSPESTYQPTSRAANPKSEARKLVVKLRGALNTLGRVIIYKYDDLQPGKIRLLQVLPGKGKETIRCRVITVYLNNPPKFNTLSYVWNVSSEDDKQSAEFTERIYLNDRYYLIAPNLLSALRFYREHYTEPLWVDFLCINQCDTQEQGKQVLHMRQIYGSAIMVLVWLGDEADDSELAIEFLERIYKEPNTAAFIVQTILSGTCLREWRALDHFWNRKWWMRLWVMQEQAASKTIEVACGSRKVAWEAIYRFTDALTTAISSGKMEACMHIIKKEGIKLNTKVLHHVITLRRLRNGTAHGKRLTILSVLDCTRRALASRGSDKIYGILGFVKDASILVPQPNYECEPQQVYKLLVLSYIDHYKNLDILAQANVHKRLDKLPSWTPDWSDDKRISRLNRTYAPTCFFHAAGDTAASISPSPNDSILTCEGFCIDILDGMCHSLAQGSSSLEQVEPLNATSVYCNDDATFSAIWRSLVSDVRYYPNSSFERAPEAMGGLFVKKCQNWENVFMNRDHESYQPDKETHPDISIFEVWYQQNRLWKVGGRSVQQWAFECFEAAQSVDDDVVLNASFERTMKKKILGRRLITTNKGYIGLAPMASKRRDIICVLFGCSTPVVLRPLEEGGYRFMGECYVHGIMEGEAMTMLGKGECVKNSFELH